LQVLQAQVHIKYFSGQEEYLSILFLENEKRGKRNQIGFGF
jgi:hypothetical protein